MLGCFQEDVNRQKRIQSLIRADAELRQGDSQDPNNDSTKVCVVNTLKNSFVLLEKELGSLESLSTPETPPDRQHLIRLLSRGLSSSNRGFGTKKNLIVLYSILP